MRIGIKRTIAAPVWGLSLLMVACGGGDNGSGPDGNGPICSAVPGTVTFTAGTSCVGCTSSNNPAAADGDFRSYATMTEPASSTGTVSMRVTRTDGSTYPAGSSAGVIYGFDGAVQANIVLSITTYRAGVMQENKVFETDQTAAYSGNTSSFHGTVSTTLPFDGVEYTYSRTSSGTVANARVYALCSN